MREPADNATDSRVLLHSVIDERHHPTGATQHFVDGVPQPPCQGLLITLAGPADQGFSLFYCDPEWNVVIDTWHASLEEAKAQAEFEYEGVSKTWVSGPPPMP